MTLKRCLFCGWVLFIATACGGAEQSAASTQSAGFSLVIGASAAPFTFRDGASGQTATHVTSGVRSLTLFTAEGATWTVFNAGSNDATVGYDGGDSTELAGTPVVPGHYVRARLVQDWSKFDIQVALHANGTTTAGALHALQVTSDGTFIEGSEHNAGYYEQTFTGGGMTRHFSGDDAPVPEYSETAGARAVVENGAWSVYFPVDLNVDAGAGALEITVNMDHAFRWTDVSGNGNRTGVYDIAPPIYEPVVQFGGNRFDASVSEH
jgi:hypothetical protein